MVKTTLQRLEQERIIHIGELQELQSSESIVAEFMGYILNVEDPSNVERTHLHPVMLIHSVDKHSTVRNLKTIGYVDYFNAAVVVREFTNIQSLTPLGANGIRKSIVAVADAKQTQDIQKKEMVVQLNFNGHARTLTKPEISVVGGCETVIDACINGEYYFEITSEELYYLSRCCACLNFRFTTLANGQHKLHLVRNRYLDL